MSSPWILPLSAVGAADLPRVGGKGANLGWMARAGLPIPDGFCITTEAFTSFLEALPDAEGLYARLEGLDPGAVEPARLVATEMRSCLERLPVPAAIQADILAAWRQLGAERRYAVRSSATAEDLPGASFAGQQDTFLNVVGEAALIDAVKRCWISLFTDRAVLYRLRNGFPHRAVSLAVVVQKMIQPESAGILFTADPVGGSRKIVSIDAGWGLGEALVSGLVTADLYRAEKETGKLLSVKVGDKAIAIRSLPEGGTVQEALPPDRRQAQVLSDEQVAELVAMGRRIEAAAGGLPQDVEWCYEAGQLHIVQARPITSLYPLPADPQGPVRLYFSFSHAQMMTDAMPPLAADLWFWLFPFGRASLTGNPADAAPQNRAMTEVGGRLYVEVTRGLANPRSRPLLLGLMTALYPQLTEAMEGQLHRLSPPQPMDPATRRGLLRFFAPVPFRLFRRLWWARPETANAEATATLDAILTGHRQALAHPTTLAGHLRAARDRLAVTFTIVPQVAPFLVAGVLAQRILGKLGVPEEVLNRLARALPGNVTTDMDLLLADLADRVRGIPGLAELLEQRGLAGAKEHPGSGPFLSAFQDFLDRYGMRGPGEIDLSRPRWGDHPESLLPMILGNLRGDQPVGAHRRRHADMEAEATQEAEKILSAAPFWRRPLLSRMIRVMRSHLAVREHPKYTLVRLFWELRKIVFETADVLMERRVLTDREQVWFLNWEELEAAVEGRLSPADAQALIQQRQAEHLLNQRRTPPLAMASDGEIPTFGRRGDLPDGALGGIGASAGVVEGRARVVRDPSADLLHAGEILVAPFTDPGWTPLFTHAAGLVTDVGGLMTHGSVVAREMGIPAVVGVTGATGRIQSGDRLRVDGSRGMVEILEKIV